MDYPFWNLITQIAVAVATLAAVLVAMFGHAIRGKLLPPRLKLKLVDPNGKPAPIILSWVDEKGSKQERTEDGRYYHVLVYNNRRWNTEQGVQVFLVRYEEPDARGDFVVRWSGELPLQWRHQSIRPLTLPIGPPSEADLFSVVKDKWLDIATAFRPTELETRKRAAFKFAVTIQAKGQLTDSNLLRLEVAWDGKWDADTQRMATHLTVKEQY